MNRDAVITALRHQRREQKPIIGAGAGVGIAAMAQEAGGADFLVVYNTARHRMAGRGSLGGMLPLGDANQLVLELSGEILPVVARIPVLAGVNGVDPFRNIPQFLGELEGVGFSGVVNYPSVGLFDGGFRESLERTGLGIGREYDMIRQAHERGLFTAPFVFDRPSTVAMLEAGADIVIAHLGPTVKGTESSLEAAVEKAQEICDAAVTTAPDVLVLCHGGAVAGVEEVRHMLRSVDGLVGYFAGSTGDQIPAERAISAAVAAFKALSNSE